MSIDRVIRRSARNLCSMPSVNTVARRLWRVMKPVIPSGPYRRFPAVGRLQIGVPGTSRRIVLINDGIDAVASEVYWTGVDGYESSTMPLFRRLMARSETFLDIGSYTGLFALIAAAIRSDARVFAFEPVPELFRCLERNVVANGFGNIMPLNVAVTDEDGEITLYIPSTSQNASASTRSGFREHTTAVTVPALTLDRFAADHGVAKIDLMKIDTETTEHRVLRGAAEVLARHRPVMICEVLPGWEENLRGLAEILNASDYVFFWLTDAGAVPCDTLLGSRKDKNHLFVPKEWLAEHGREFGLDSTHQD